MTPGEYLRRLSNVDVSLASMLAIEDTASVYTEKQREQLFQGIRSDGEPITPAYRPRTIRIKQRKGQPVDRVTLRDTGDFYRGILIDVRQDIFTVQSADEKNISLQARYGTAILGLATAAQIEYVKSLRPVFIQTIKKQMTG